MSNTKRNQKNQAGIDDGAASSSVVRIEADGDAISPRLAPFLPYYFQMYARDPQERSPANKKFTNAFKREIKALVKELWP
jgi:hypothetical protein